MKNLPLLLFMVIYNYGFAQLTVEIVNNRLEIKLDESSNNQRQFQIKYIDENNEPVTKDFSGLPQCLDESTIPSEDTLGKIIYKTDCDEKMMKLWRVGDKEKNAQGVVFCGNDKIVKKDSCDDDNLSEKKSNNSPTDITQIPIPIFNYTQNEKFNYVKKARYLIIDADPNPFQKENNTLYRKKEEKDGDSITVLRISEYFKEVSSIPVDGSLAIFLENYKNIEEVNIEIEGLNYEYNQDLGDIRSQLLSPTDTSVSDGEKAEATSTEVVENERKEYLEKVLEKLTEVDHLNLNDLLVLKEFKEQLQETILQNNIKLTTNQSGIYSAILSWNPKWLSLTPIALSTAKDFDELVVKASIQGKNENNSKTNVIGRFKGKGGFSVDVGSMIYFTRLKNNKVYTDSVDVENGSNELRARINEKNQTSIGLGLNSEFAFRTGTLRPTLNVGFFVPFDEELSPFIAAGPGVSISSGNVKFSLSGGIAFGKINAIAEQYDGVDLSTVSNLTNESISEKVWETDWYIGLGARFNIKKEED